MNNYNKIWSLAKPYLRKGMKKDFVLHTEGVVKAMKMICEKESGDTSLLIPSAILHDVGWAKVPKKLQKSKRKNDTTKGLKFHLEYSKPIIQDILTRLRFNKIKINKIVEIVNSHKFCNPRNINKRIMIDADALSDSFKKQFVSDAESYKLTYAELYKFRKTTNKFYTKTAKEIFSNEIEKRKNGK